MTDRQWHRRVANGEWVGLHTVLDWNPGDLLWKDGVRATNVARTIIDMAGRGVPLRQIERAVDSGVRLMREVLLDSGGESDLERRFLRLMRIHGLPRPTTQVAFGREQGRGMRVDFHFPAADLVVEVSGRLGHTSDRDRQVDARVATRSLDKAWP